MSTQLTRLLWRYLKLNKYGGRTVAQQRRGKYILVEGMEGAGKSTVIAAMEAQLRELGVPFITVAEPGSTALGQALRTIVKEAEYPIDPVAEAMLFAAARRQLLKEVVEPALAKGISVLSDRGLGSSYAYQGGARGCYNQVLDLASITFDVVDQVYDLTFYLDIPADVGLARAKARGALDRIEQEGPEFFDVVETYYRDIFARTEIAGYFGEVRLIDATQSMEDVAEAVTDQLRSFLR